MLLWSVIAVGFVVCLAAGHLWRGITWGEAGILFIASSIIFAVHLGFIYNKTTTDHYLISGYVTSLVHQPAYSYQSGTKIISKPEKYIIEQQPRPAIQDRTITRRLNEDKVTEICRGGCLIFYRNFWNMKYTPPG